MTIADLNTLRLFAVIARHRSFRRAATELGLSPATLSDGMHMIAVPLGGTQQFLVVGSPSYLADCGRPDHPDQLASHRRLAHRFKTGNMPDWEFEKDRRVIRFAPNGPVTTSDPACLVAAARAGLGLAYMFTEYVLADLEEERCRWSLRTGPRRSKGRSFTSRTGSRCRQGYGPSWTS